MRLVKPASNFARAKIEAADRQLKWWAYRGLVPLLLAVPVGLAVSLLDEASGTVAGILLGSAGLVMIAVGFSYWSTASSSRKGWAGEVSLAAELSYLNDEFLLLNDVMLPGAHGNIDHVLVGPTGVFVFETKNYSGKYVCYGDKWYFQGKWQKYDVKSVSNQVKNNTSLVAGLLHSSGFTVDISPVIVFTNPSAKLWLHHPTVPILRAGTVCNFVVTQRPRFNLTGRYSQSVAEKILNNDVAKNHAHPLVSA